jgi:replication factor A1
VSGGGGQQSLDQRRSVSSIKNDGLGMGEKADYSTIKATVTFIKSEPDPWYTACIGPDCQKKVYILSSLLLF